MSLATRCTHCGTIFKVVQDQLKVSEGWVRCGRCNEVFNALPALFDLDTEAPPPRPNTPGMAPAAPVTSTPPAAPVGSTARSPSPPAPPASAPRKPDTTAVASTVPPTPPAVPTRADVLGDAPLNLTVGRRTLDDFELDTSVPLRDVPAAVPAGAAARPSSSDALGDTLPLTSEADALESRYLLPSASRARKAPARRVQGPEFADAEFPMDAWLDAEDDWSLDVPPLPSSAPPSLARQTPSHEPSPLIRDPDSVPAPVSDTRQSETITTPPSVAEQALAALAASDDDIPSTVPSRFADEEDRPPSTADLPGTASDGPAPTEAELMAQRQSVNKGKHRRVGQETPTFIRQAERQALWRNPGVRGVLTGLSLALLLTLMAQWAHQQRDWLAAHIPASRPWLTTWCDTVGCELKHLRRLNLLQVDHAALVRAESEGPDRYRLSLVVRNAGDTELAWPAVDLVLNDANGVVLARRTLKTPDADWQVEAPVRASAGVRPGAAIEPLAQGTLSWSLQLEGIQPTGYTAELFYPPDHP